MTSFVSFGGRWRAAHPWRVSRAIGALLFALHLLLPAADVLASDLADSLRAGTHVLLMRHANAPGVGDPPGYTLERCESQRQLDGSGRAQARRVGAWLREQGVDRADVYTSPWCRCRQTADGLQLGPVTVEPSLGSFFDQPQRAVRTTQSMREFITRARSQAKGRALILVTHHVNIREYVGLDVGVGDMVLARVDAQGRLVDYRLYPSP